MDKSYSEVSEEIQLVNELEGQMSPRISEGNEAEQDWEASVDELISEADALLDEALCSNEFGNNLDDIIGGPQELNRGEKRGAAAEGHLSRQHACRSPSLQEVMDAAESEFDMLRGLSSPQRARQQGASCDAKVLGRTAWYRGEKPHGHEGLETSGTGAIAAASTGPSSLATAPHLVGKARLGGGSTSSRSQTGRSERSDGGSMCSRAESVGAQMGDDFQESAGDLSEDEDELSIDMMPSISQQC